MYKRRQVVTKSAYTVLNHSAAYKYVAGNPPYLLISYLGHSVVTRERSLSWFDLR